MNYPKENEIPVFQNRTGWFTGRGNLFDTVLSTRIRLSRNIAGYRFPETMEREERIRLNARLRSFYGERDYFSRKGNLYPLAALNPRTKRFLTERRILSARQEEFTRGEVILGEDESINILLGLDDHLLFLGLKNGFGLPRLYKRIKTLESETEAVFPFSRDGDRGVLTSRIGESGTGLRISVIMQLPALSLLEDMDRLFLALMDRGLSIRGYNDEEDSSLGALYQIYNGTGAGFKRDEDILNSFTEAVKILSGKEEICRREINRGCYPRLEDRIYRSLGTLRYCRLLSEQEALKHLLLIRQGISLGWITEISLEMLSALQIFSGEAHLQGILLEEGRIPTPEEENERRARLIREALSGGMTWFGV